MANLRKIKKDISFLVEEVISDCCLFMSFHPGKNDAEAEAILIDAANLHNALYERVNHRPEKGAKQHCSAVSKDLLEEVDRLFGRISQLSK
jgi:hypothetical protein